MEHKQYLSKIGKKGGKVKSEAKRQAGAKNLKIARKAKQTQTKGE